MLLLVGSIAIGLFAIELAATVHWSFGLLLFLVPVWMAVMFQVMEWATDL